MEQWRDEGPVERRAMKSKTSLIMEQINLFAFPSLSVSRHPSTGLTELWMEVISESSKRKAALSKCKERKWSTSRLSGAIMPRNLAEGGQRKGRLKKTGKENGGMKR